VEVRGVYIDEEYYKSQGYDKVEGFSKYMQRAFDIINNITLNRIESNMQNLTDYQKQNIKRAACYIVNYLASDDAPDYDISAYSMQNMRIMLRKRKLRAWEVYNIPKEAFWLIMDTGLARGAI